MLGSEAAPLADLALLQDAALAAGPLLRDAFGAHVQTWTKPGGSPVTEIDLAVNALLHTRLMQARPDYGWLSEESPDDPVRLQRRCVFVLDPLDGTIAFLRGEKDFCISVAVVEDGEPIAALVFAPMTNEVFAAARGAGATLNGAPIRASTHASVEDCRMIGPKDLFAHPSWSPPWPSMTILKRNAIAYRLGLIAADQGDGAISLGYKHEWDIAAGVLLVREAGGMATDPWGACARFNQPDPRWPGIVASGGALHPLLIARTKATPHPSKFPSNP